MLSTSRNEEAMKRRLRRDRRHTRKIGRAQR